MLSTVAEIIRDLLIFVGVIAALLIALIVVVAKLPDTNPLKRLLTALCYRPGVTLAAGAIAIPLEPIPGIDLAYEVAVPKNGGLDSSRPRHCSVGFAPDNEFQNGP